MSERKSPGLGVVAALWLLFLGYGIYLFVFGPYAALAGLTGGKALPEESFGFTGGELYVFLGSLRQNEVEAYSVFQLYDSLNAVLTALALSVSVWAAAARYTARRSWRMLLVLPLLMGAFDLLENFLIISAIRNLPLKYYGIGEAAGTAALLKMITGAAGVVSLLAFVAYGIALRLRGRKSDGS